jgi:phasin family protein
MAHPSKKTSHSHSAPKLAATAHSTATKAVSNTADKAAAAARSAVETTRSSAESMLKISTDTAKEFFASGSEEAQKAHDNFFAISRGGAENASRAVEALTRTLNDFVGLARENADAAAEVHHIAADIAKSINSELMSCANTNFSDNVELCKEMFSCRDINDALELHSKFLSTNMDNFFTQSTRLAEMMLQLATEAAEPINERVAEASS